jgi:hypothetical protein
MSNSPSIIRATATVRIVQGKKDPSKRYGFQTCGLMKAEGMFAEFDAMFDPAKSSHFLPPGDYEVHEKGAYLDQNGRLQLGKEFVAVAAAKKAA